MFSPTLGTFEWLSGERITLQISFSAATRFWFEIVEGVKSGDDIPFRATGENPRHNLAHRDPPQFPRVEQGEVD
jgi:hypothetical protein